MPRSEIYPASSNYVELNVLTTKQHYVVTLITKGHKLVVLFGQAETSKSHRITMSYDCGHRAAIFIEKSRTFLDRINLN